MRNELPSRRSIPKSTTRHTHLFALPVPVRLLEHQARRELHEVVVHARHDRRDARRARGARRAGVRHVDAHHHRLLPRQPPHRVRVELVVHPAELRVHLERDVREVLVLLLRVRVPRLRQQHVHRVQPELHVRELLDARVDAPVDPGQQHEHEARLLLRGKVRPEDLLDRVDRARAVRGVAPRGRQVHAHDAWGLVRARAGDPARVALGEERLQEARELGVARALELAAPAVVDDEDRPVRHVPAHLELHVEDVPAGVLDARGARGAAVGDGRGREDAVGDDLHVLADGDAEGP